jgi:NAD(P)-dependent dehydrogenase (short-subunit alcohol dehydrogenase family)
MSKVWFVTGSSRGLGFEIAKAVLAAGDRLVATARDPKVLQPLVAQLGDRVRTVALDVTRAEEVNAVVASVGRIDVLVNNAGYANVNSIEHVAADDFRAQMETNFFGVVNVTRAVLPIMRAQRSGHIIQISSIGGRAATPGLGAYQSAKWAVGGFSEVLAKEVAPLGIHVTVAEPGGMRTDWAGSSMRIDAIEPDYAATVGAFAKVRDASWTPQSDPAKVARALVAVANEPTPPLRLLLGSDAVFMAGILGKARAAEDEAWKELSLSTDTDGLPIFSETPVAQYLAPRHSAPAPAPRK